MFSCSFCQLLNFTSPSNIFKLIMCAYTHAHTHAHAHAYNVSTLLYYFSNSEGCGRKLCKNSLQDASLFVPIILYPYLSPPSFPSIVQGGTSGLVNMFIHVHTHSPFSNILRPECCRGLDNVRIYSRYNRF